MMMRPLAIVVVVAVSIAAGCTRPRPAPPPAPRADVVVLMPDPEDGHVGSAVVTSAGADVELTHASEGTRVVQGRAPGAAAPVPADEVQRTFGEAMEARPLAPRQFLLYFETASDTLTPESQALLPEIINAVHARPAPDVSVIGHTDTTGDAASNVALGLRRAMIIRDALVAAGLEPGRIEIASHGEADLLVTTPDNTSEPRNRRVEVTVR